VVESAAMATHHETDLHAEALAVDHG